MGQTVSGWHASCDVKTRGPRSPGAGGRREVRDGPYLPYAVSLVLLLIVVSSCPASMDVDLRIEPANGLEADFAHRHELQAPVHAKALRAPVTHRRLDKRDAAGSRLAARCSPIGPCPTAPSSMERATMYWRRTAARTSPALAPHAGARRGLRLLPNLNQILTAS